MDDEETRESDKPLFSRMMGAIHRQHAWGNAIGFVKLPLIFTDASLYGGAIAQFYLLTVAGGALDDHAADPLVAHLRRATKLKRLAPGYEADLAQLFGPGWRAAVAATFILYGALVVGGGKNTQKKVKRVLPKCDHVLFDVADDMRAARRDFKNCFTQIAKPHAGLDAAVAPEHADALVAYAAEFMDGNNAVVLSVRCVPNWLYAVGVGVAAAALVVARRRRGAMLKRSYGEANLSALVQPQFASASDAERRAKRRRTGGGGGDSSGGDTSDAPPGVCGSEASGADDPILARRPSDTWDTALLAAYVVDCDPLPGADRGLGMGLEMLAPEPSWTGSWASHQAHMSFLYGGTLKAAKSPPRSPEKPKPPRPDDDGSGGASQAGSDLEADTVIQDGRDRSASEDEPATRVAEGARGHAKQHALRRGFFASALKRRLESLQEENARLKRVATECLSVDERKALFESLGSSRTRRRPSSWTNPELPDNPIVWTSEAFLQMTGYDRDDVIGRNCRFLQGPRTDPRQVSVIRDAAYKEHEASVTILNYRKDGTTFWNRFFVAPLRDAEGKVTFFVGVQTDVSAAFARPGTSDVDTPKPSPATLPRSLGSGA
ncbi:phosphorelay sensor kinase [Aureococcus anophagefferens]|nr:phosphorelay sensor kinase [Aureococcus anophagefferens]